MSLMSEQAQFLADVFTRLYPFIHEHGIDAITGGELYRTQEQEAIYQRDGKSATSNSMHLQRCAIDLNLFIRMNGSFAIQNDKVKLQPIFDYWESLDPKNRSGGNFKTLYDPGHFERHV